MILKNASYLDENFAEKTGDLQIEEGILQKVGKNLPYSDRDMVVDCAGYRIVPGFVDLHIHGCVGYDACDGDKQGLLEMARFLVSKGVTSFCPTTMTLAPEEIENALSTIAAARDEQSEGSTIAGINLEGPFISKAKKGAQQGEFIKAPDMALFRRFMAASGGLIKLIDIAPEGEGAMDFIEQAKDLATVSVAHTTAGYDLAKKSFAAGITHATHLYNAMTGLHHRDPGVVGAVFDTDTVRAELVCDGHHIHPAVVRSTFRQMGDRIIVISDAMRLCGLSEGDSGTLGGQQVTVTGGKATLADGTIAGSVTNLHDELKNLVSWGIPFAQAVRAMTLTPAEALGLQAQIGSIAPGKKADLVVLDEQLSIAAVYH